MAAKSKVNLWETHTSTVLSITLVMLLLGLCLLVEYHIYRATHDMQERITFKVDLVADIEDSNALSLKKQIEALPYVRHVDYISREEAADIFTEDLDDDFVGFIGYNPLYPSLMVNLKADYMPETSQDTRAQSINRFTADVSHLEGVTGVAYQENIVGELNDIFYKATWFLIIFMVLLTLISILMIRSTISIALYAQRDTIRTMQLVGARTSFIASPFLARSVAYGLLGALFAILVLVIALGVFNQSFHGMNLLDRTHLLWYGGIAVVVALLGVVLSYLSTLSAVYRFTRNKR